MELQDLSAKELILFGLIMRGYYEYVRDIFSNEYSMLRLSELVGGSGVMKLVSQTE